MPGTACPVPQRAALSSKWLWSCWDLWPGSEGKGGLSMATLPSTAWGGGTQCLKIAQSSGNPTRKAGARPGSLPVGSLAGVRSGVLPPQPPWLSSVPSSRFGCQPRSLLLQDEALGACAPLPGVPASPGPAGRGALYLY